MIRLFPFVFVVLAFAAPWPIGGNWPFTRTLFLGVCALLLIGAALEILQCKGSRINDKRQPLIVWCLLAGIAFTIFQSSEASSGVQKHLGERNVAVSAALNVGSNDDSLSAAEREILPRPISVYVPATRQKLIDLIYGVGIFLAASVFLIDWKRIYPVFFAIVLAGAAVSFVGVLQQLSGDRRIFWQYELLWGGSAFGPFVNGNNAAGFLAVCFSAGVFFVVWYFLKWKQRSDENVDLVRAGDQWSAKNPPRVDVSYRLLEFVANLKPSHLYFLTAMAVLVAGVFVSLSRGGMLAISLSGLTALYLISKTSRAAVVALALMICVGSVTLPFLSEQSASISEEIQSMSDLSDAVAPRLDHWKDAVPFGLRNGLLGVGNGTYRYVSPVFQTFFLPRTFAHAESIYIETLVELGWGGLVLLLATIGSAFFAGIELLRRNEPLDRSLGSAAITCLVGQVVMATVDFGIYQPANTTVMAILMGAVVGRYSCAADGTTRYPNSTASGKFVFAFQLIVVFVLIALACWAVYESYGVESRRAAQRSIKLYNKYAGQGLKGIHGVSLDEVQQQLETAAAIRPDDAEVHYLLGDLHIARFRDQEARKLQDQLQSEIEQIENGDLSLQQQNSQLEELKKLDSETIWNITAVSLLHKRLRRAESLAPAEAVQIKSDPSVIKHLKKAVKEFQQSEQLCPRTAKVQYRLAQLIALTSSSSATETRRQESDFISEALRRSVPKTPLLFNCGLLALNSGDQARAIDLWKKCLSQPHRRYHEGLIVEFCLQDLPMKQFYEEVLPQNAKYLVEIAKRYFRSPELKLPKKFFITHVRRIINEDPKLDEIDRISLLAESAMLIDDYPEAVKQFEKALLLAPTQASRRYDYALALFQTKQFDESVRQLKMCELDPTVRKNRIKSLLAKIRKERVSTRH